MAKNQIIMFLKHPNFNFEEAKKVTLAYALSNEILTVTDISDILSISRSKLTRYIKVSIIFSLVSEESVNKIIAKRKVYVEKGKSSMKNSICSFEDYIELAKEREQLIRKLDFFKKCFKDKKNFDDLCRKNIDRIIEIEKFAFK